MRHITCLFLIATLAGVHSIHAQTDSSAKVDFAFQQKIPEWMKEANVPAVGIGIITDGRLGYVRVFGELNKGRGVPAPANTIFQVASLTKPIVEVLTLQLVTKGEWKLDEPLANYWVDPDVQNDPRHKQLTTRHVLTHRSGFQNWRSMNAAKKLEFIVDPGTKGELFRRRSRVPAPRARKEVQATT